MHMVTRHAYRQNAHTHKIKSNIKKLPKIDTKGIQMELLYSELGNFPTRHQILPSKTPSGRNELHLFVSLTKGVS